MTSVPVLILPPRQATVEPAWQREHLRQQMLLGALLKPSAHAEGRVREVLAQDVTGWVQEGEARARRGLQAYVANAGASAERALASSFPTVQALMGLDAFAAMSRAYWQAHPPARGDLAWMGEALPGFIEGSAQLAGEPYLADTARLDWAIHRAEAAFDASFDSHSLALLAERDPADLTLAFMPGMAVIASAYPIAAIWRAHQSPNPLPNSLQNPLQNSITPACDATDRFSPVREAMSAQRGEHALVWRSHWQARVASLSAPEAEFTQALLVGCSLMMALNQTPIDFEAWLRRALESEWLQAAQAPVRIDT